MIAVLPIRHGTLPTGAESALATAGRAILIGSDVETARQSLRQSLGPLGDSTAMAEVGAYRPAAWARALAPHLDPRQPVLVPGSPDGRHLAARLAALGNRRLYTGVTELDEARQQVSVVRFGGRVSEIWVLEPGAVLCLESGVFSPPADSHPSQGADRPRPAASLDLALALDDEADDAELLEELPADPATMDLTEARRIIAGGAGLRSPDAFDLLAEVGEKLAASVGGTRVVMDWGWIPFERQIGTTGVVVDPDLYLALGISGAVQHTAGLGQPQHIVSVNTDPHCPMMAMADLAIVADAPEVLAALQRRLSTSDADDIT